VKGHRWRTFQKCGVGLKYCPHPRPLILGMPPMNGIWLIPLTSIV